MSVFKTVKSFNVIKAAVAVKNKYKNMNIRKKNISNGFHLKVKRKEKFIFYFIQYDLLRELASFKTPLEIHLFMYNKIYS
jgi:hypothetical protein